ncbi:histidinol dehydrogenase [Parapedobacter tibetensis]|uniref:histidinol dehydrogenase n=1 Tax=Parapedobacter tibetensis TaxID=2972951 RepID=UPI00214D751B|nr:histidinol dehydrogenase [Parapedobacter tibetensis]
MLKTYTYSSLNGPDIQKLLTRNTDPSNAITQSVVSIIDDVRANGDAALKAYAERFDGVHLEKLYLEADEIAAIASSIGREQRRALEIAFANIYRFHETQLRKEKAVETMPGVKCWREPRPIEKVGLYIPGGSAVLPSTLLMLGVPARIAGCKEIVVCSPPQANGMINGYVAYCLQLLKIDKIYLVGGAQAIAAMAYGTASISKVDKIFGPGNQYVTKAKSLVQSKTNVSIDMPAGPSEVLVVADGTGNPQYIAADLLAQAEHGPDSQAILVSTDQTLIADVQVALEEQLAQLPRATMAAKALANSYAILCSDLDEALAFSNQYAPEHLIIETEDWESLVQKISNAGSVFLGHDTPESAGDYASGTNHTLPTSGYARSYSGVSVDSFVKKITFQHITMEGLRNIGPTVELLAELEDLQAHKNAVSIRLG